MERKVGKEVQEEGKRKKKIETNSKFAQLDL